MAMTDEQIQNFIKKFSPCDCSDTAGPEPTIDPMQKDLDIANQRIEILERRVKDLIKMHAKLANKLTIVRGQVLFSKPE